MHRFSISGYWVVALFVWFPELIVSGIIIDDLSDHLPIFAIRKQIAPQKTYSKRKVGKINDINAEHFIADLQSQLNSKLNFDKLTSANLLFGLLYETFHEVLEDHAPFFPSRKQQQLSKKTWMTANIHKLIRKNIKCFMKFITTIKLMPILFISNFENVLIGQ